MQDREAEKTQEAEGILAELLTIDDDYTDIKDIPLPVSGSPISDPEIFELSSDRIALVSQIEESNRNKTILLVGATRMGKTSIGLSLSNYVFLSLYDYGELSPNDLFEDYRELSESDTSGVFIDEASIFPKDVNSLLKFRNRIDKTLVLSLSTNNVEIIERQLMESKEPYEIVEVEPLDNENMISYIEQFIDKHPQLAQALAKLSGGSLYVANLILSNLKFKASKLFTEGRALNSSYLIEAIREARRDSTPEAQFARWKEEKASAEKRFQEIFPDPLLQHLEHFSVRRQ